VTLKKSRRDWLPMLLSPPVAPSSPHGRLP
jgi:hypothetical protein